MIRNGLKRLKQPTNQPTDRPNASAVAMPSYIVLFVMNMAAVNENRQLDLHLTKPSHQ